jgi:hypothetical protein
VSAPDDERWPLPKVILAAAVAGPLIVMRFNRSSARWAKEVEAHPSTWPIRVVALGVVAIPAVVAMKWLRDRDQQTDPLWKRLLHLAGIGLVGWAMIAIWLFLERCIP